MRRNGEWHAELVTNGISFLSSAVAAKLITYASAD
jgi:hypothetical protein